MTDLYERYLASVIESHTERTDRSTIELLQNSLNKS
jgi:hypothetical protein